MITCEEIVDRYRKEYLNKLQTSSSLTMEEVIKQDSYKEVIIILDKILYDISQTNGGTNGINKG